VSRADQLLAKVRKAAKHPKALLFGALAAECRTPSKTASVARKEYGLSNEEEKLAKAVAVLKRDSRRRFSKSYLEVLAEVIGKLEKPKERKMKIRWGSEHFKREVGARQKRISVWILTELETIAAKKNLDVVVRINEYSLCHVYVFPSNLFPGDELYGKNVWHSRSVVTVAFTASVYLQEGLRSFKKECPAIEIEVNDKDFISLARSFGRAYEKEAKRSCVEIIRRY